MNIKQIESKYRFLVGILLFIIISFFVVFPKNAVASSEYDLSSSESNIIARYSVVISVADATQNKVRVKAFIQLNGTTDLTASPCLGPFMQNCEQKIFIEKCYDKANNPVDIKQIDNRTWRVYATSGVTIEYTARVDIPSLMSHDKVYLSYLSNNCGLIDAKIMLLAPSFNGKAIVNFTLPDGWNVIADETWVPVSSTAYAVNITDFDAVVAPGKWNLYNSTFGDGQKLTVAICGKTRYPESDYIKNFKVCADYFNEHVGKLPQKELSIIVADLPLPRDFMSGPPRLIVSRTDIEWNFEGTFWHYWFLHSGGTMPLLWGNLTQSDIDRVWWFEEGASPFILNPIIEQVGAVADIERATGLSFGWKGWYGGFKPYIGTQYDIPLVNYPQKYRETSDINYYVPGPYLKSYLVLQLLNDSISEVTHGTKDMRNVIKYVYENYVLPQKAYTVKDILSVVNTVSGNDYSSFFDAYVYGNERLPIIEANNDYTYDWITLGNRTYKTVANVENAMPKYAKAPVTLEYKKEDKYFSVYFHPQDEKEAVLLLLGEERAYNTIAKIYGGTPKFKIKNFLTYDRDEAVNFGYNPPGGLVEGASGGGPSSEIGDELIWLNPIGKKENQILLHSKLAHELGHATMRQLYPGIFFSGVNDSSQVESAVQKGLYNKYWRSWFDEGLATYTEIVYWLDNPDLKIVGHFIDHEAFMQLVDSSKTGNPPIINFSDLDNATRTGDQKSRYLVEAEGITFVSYIFERYGQNGIPKLLTEYSRGVPIEEAVKNAFNISFDDFQSDWKNFVDKAASNVGSYDSELTRIRNEGFDTSRAETVKSQEPFLGLFMAYVDEKYGTPRVVETTTTSSSTTSTSITKTSTTLATSLKISTTTSQTSIKTSSYKETISKSEVKTTKTSTVPEQINRTSELIPISMPTGFHNISTFPWPLLIIGILILVVIILVLRKLLKKK